LDDAAMARSLSPPFPSPPSTGVTSTFDEAAARLPRAPPRIKKRPAPAPPGVAQARASTPQQRVVDLHRAPSSSAASSVKGRDDDAQSDVSDVS
jgi:hypothetical protein